MPEFKNASSRTSSISSSDSFTTSEGESDSERGMSIGSMEDSSHLMITLPNPTKPRSNSKTKADSPKKRSRDGKPAENKPKGGKKSVDDTIDFPIPHDMGVNGDVLFDFMQLDNYEAGDDLDHSIINLLEKIDWNVPGSRPHSPFMDSANLVTVSMDSWDGSETNSQLSDFHPMQTGFLADIGIDTVPSSNNSNSFSNIPNLQPTSLLADSVPSVDSKTSSSLKELTKPSLISDNCNSTFGLPLVSPTAISAPHVYSPVASSNHLCEEPNTQKDGEFGSFPFDNDEPDGDNDFSQPKKRGRSIDPIISATNFALTENKSGMLVAANENIGDKFEDLLDSGILLDSF